MPRDFFHRLLALGVLPAARLRRAVPAPTGRTGQRSAFPCQRVALHGGVGPRRAPSRNCTHARRGVQANPFMSVSPGGGRHRCAQRSERRVPRTRPDDAERRDSGREGTTSELGVLPAARLRRAVPAPTGRTGQRSAFPCQRVALHGPAARRSSYRISVKWAESCALITDPIPLPGDALELSQMLPGIVLIGQELQ